MSIRIMTAIWAAKLGPGKGKDRPTTASVRKGVAVKLADWARDDGTKVFPAIETIAAQSEVHERTVQRVIKELVSEGLLVVVKEGGKGAGHTTEYRFDLNVLFALPLVDATPRVKGDQGSPLIEGKGDLGSDKGDPEHNKGDPAPPNPLGTSKRTVKSARKRTGRLSKSDLKAEEGDEPMGLTPSAEAKARGMTLAKGWSYEHLLEEFREMNSREDREPINDVDAAWVGFCRYVGPNSDKPTFKATGKVVPLKPAPADHVTITRLEPEWPHWIEHLEKLGDRATADRMRSSRTPFVYVPSKYPATANVRPTFPVAA